jgi:type II secretory ATPase GspE/PulE/Tfp pilus assembly ATPase PilB-like protein
MNADFGKFKIFLFDRLQINDENRLKYASLTHDRIYDVVKELGMTSRQVAMAIAEYLKLPHTSLINYENLRSGILQKEFCFFNSVAPINDESGRPAFLISNPFDWQLLNVLSKYEPGQKTLNLIVTEPENIRNLIDYKKDSMDEEISIQGDQDKHKKTPVIDPVERISSADMEKRPVIYVSNNILYTAMMERASDVHIEPKEFNSVVRFRIDGDLRDFFTLSKQTGVMLISRFKALGGLDIAERLKPQDGSVEAIIDKRTFKLRLATTSTPNGESLIIRILEPTAKPKDLSELGMTNTQVMNMIEFSKRRFGLVLIVGPTGAGKTTTIYSFLSRVDCKSRSLISVEDPVEYRIPDANQQQVNDKAGVTFDALLRSSVRQDPDILYLGEVRDNYSAKTAVDFASTGHMTITTLHTNNATTAIFRLERLGISRGMMADSLLGIVAQRLLKKLCIHCKKIEPILPEEADMLCPFTDELPTHVAHPVGCAKCANTGYFGREGVYEVMSFDSELVDMIRNNAPISEIRLFMQRRGDYLISNHAVEKVKNLIFPPKDAYEKVLVEEVAEPCGRQIVSTVPDKKAAKPSILVVEDDIDNQVLIARILESAGYEVTVAHDGIDALMNLGKTEFNLIISDINMPNLDGFKLLEMKNQKGIVAPLIFLTGRSDDVDEAHGLELGAMDYIRKPIRKDVMLSRVKKLLR